MINYKEILSNHWEAFKAPRTDKSPTLISTFAGCGGSSLGYGMAGFREKMAVEWNNNAVAVFKDNFKGVPVYQGDIANLSVDQCLNMGNLERGQLDVLDGSPPCQGFSVSGKREMNDDRNQLFREFVRLLIGLKPKVFVMENVGGMVQGKMRLIFVEVLKSLKDVGYHVSARLLSADSFRVPQSRKRMIFIGVRNDLGIGPSHPKAESRPITFAEAANNCDYIDDPHMSPCILPIIPKIQPGKAGNSVTKGKFFSLRRLEWNKPAKTITKSDDGSRCGLVHPYYDRLITIEEAKRVGSFPDEYSFKHCDRSYRKVIALIGNSVPPMLMRAIASHIRSEILEKAK